MRVKNLFQILTALLVVAMVSCSGNKKEITPSSTEFTSGQIAMILQVVEKPSEMTLSEKDGAIPSQIIRLKVTLKNTQGGGENIDPRMLDFTRLLSVAVVEVTDENGARLFDLNVADSDLLKLKKLILGAKDSTDEIVFQGTFYNSEDVPKWFKEAKHFVPTLTADMSIGETSTASSSVEGSEEVMAEEPAVGGDDEFDVNNVLLPSPLKGKVEVISAEKGTSSYGYPEMTITFKLLSKVNTRPLCSEGGQMWIYGVGETESGIAVKSLLPNYGEWRSHDSDGEEFKTFLEGDPDDTITMEFTGDKDGSSNVAEDLEKVKKFKLKLSK